MLTKEELNKINGGAVNWAIVGVAGSIITFLIGLADGYLRPLKCN